jgi:hypothetical protein
MENIFRLDRTYSTVLSFEEADKEFNDYSALSWQERFRIHQHLNSIVYGYAGKEPPRMDKTVFSYGKIEDGKCFSY